MLAARPAEVSGWLRLAYADRMQHGRLTEAGIRAFEMSYTVNPFAYRQSPWRLAFALNNWSSLSPQARQEALKEIDLVKQDWWIWQDTKAAVASTTDPSGRMAAVLSGVM